MESGGQGAFIGAVHRMAAALDGQIRLVAGAFSSDAEKSRLSGEELFIHPSRVYRSYEEMIMTEKIIARYRKNRLNLYCHAQSCAFRTRQKWQSKMDFMSFVTNHLVTISKKHTNFKK